ncbi:hypothetical protein LCGC14_1763280, partial [marine sediment metagenome]
MNLAATDQVTDSPTNNFCTMNPLSPVGTPPTYTEGNLQVHDGTVHAITATDIITHKAYWEIYINTFSSGGLLWGIWDITGNPADASSYTAAAVYCWIASSTGAGDYYVAGVDDSGAHGNTAATDKLMFAYDPDTGKFWLGVNGVWNEGDPAAGTGAGMTVGAGIRARMTPYYATNGGAGGGLSHFNFGQDSTNVSTGNADDNGYGDFEYDVPAGFLALCSANMTDPSWMTDYTEDYVDDGFNVVLYTGNSTTGQSITGVGHQPDMVVIKNRETVVEWKVIDSVRGATKELNWDSTNAESTDAQGLTSFDADGFTLGTTSDTGYNENTKDMVSYNWKESTTYGFDIVQFTGTSSAHTENHGLGVVPECIILLCETAGQNHAVYHIGMDASAPEDYGMFLDLTLVRQDNTALWNDTAPTSSVFTVGTAGDTNGSGKVYVGYLFASIEGFSKFGSYEGNGSVDGPFLYCGFRPAFVIVKGVTSPQTWMVTDAMRDTYN